MIEYRYRTHPGILFDEIVPARVAPYGIDIITSDRFDRILGFGDLRLNARRDLGGDFVHLWHPSRDPFPLGLLAQLARAFDTILLRKDDPAWTAHRPIPQLNAVHRARAKVKTYYEHLINPATEKTPVPPLSPDDWNALQDSSRQLVDFFTEIEEAEAILQRCGHAVISDPPGFLTLDDIFCAVTDLQHDIVRPDTNT